MSPDSNQWDVIIAGGGPAGISTALHLIQRDPAWAARVLVIERERYPRPKLCGGGIMDYGCQALERLGLDVRAVPHVEVREAQLVYGPHRLTFRRAPLFRVVRRDVFDAWLAAKAMNSGVTVRQGEAVTDAVAHDGGVTVHTSAGTYSARTLVAADGSKGTLARGLGLEHRGPVARLLEVLTPADDAASSDLHARQLALFDFDAVPRGLQGYTWHFPCVVDGKACVNRGVYDARAAAGPAADLRAILRDSLARRGADLARCELMGHPLRGFDPRSAFSRPHVLLAGDAAGTDPLFGEGISFSLGYGAVAAAAIEDAFARGDFRYGDYRERFRASDHGRALETRASLARRLYRIRSPILHHLGVLALQVVTLLMPGTRPYRLGARSG